jgi:diacylglycerol kinase family enzyme
MLGSLIISPLASRIRDAPVRARVTEAALGAMHDRGATEIEVHETGDPGSVRAAADAAVAGGAGLVVVAGGDGTVRDASGPLAASGIPVGIVPCGTGNLYATAIGVPRSVDAALAAIRSGSPRPHDVASVRITPPGAGTDSVETPFVVACGTGLDARLMAATSREAKSRYGVAAYFLAASRLLADLAPRPTVLEVDGHRQELASIVVLVANSGEAIPGRLRPRLPIRPDDGLLHVFVLPRGGLLHGIRGSLELMLAETTGASSSGAGLRLTGTRVRVSTEPAGLVQVDGDVFQEAALDARIRPGGLLVLQP